MKNRVCILGGLLLCCPSFLHALQQQKQHQETLFITQIRELLNKDRDFPGLGDRLDQENQLQPLAQQMKQTIMDYRAWYQQELGWYRFLPQSERTREMICAKRQELSRNAAENYAQLLCADHATYQYVLFSLAEQSFPQQTQISLALRLKVAACVLAVVAGICYFFTPYPLWHRQR